MNTKMDRKVNKVIPVFFREKGCIEKFFVFPRAIKYCIFHSKIQGLPYILYRGFLYDGIIWKARSIRMIRFISSLVRRGPVGRGMKGPFFRIRKGSFIKSECSLSNRNIHSVVPVLDRREDFEKATIVLGFCFFRDDLMGQREAA